MFQKRNSGKEARNGECLNQTTSSGALAKYALLVGSAANGATTDPSNFLKMIDYLQKRFSKQY